MSNNLYPRLFDKLLTHYRVYGFWASLYEIARKGLLKIVSPIITFHEVVLVEKLIVGKSDPIVPKIGIVINRLKENDYAFLRAVSQHADEKFIEKRVGDKEECFVAKSNGDICYYEWIAPGERTVTYRSYLIPIGRDEAYLHDIKTLSCYRGNNVAPFVINYTNEILAKRGYRRIVALTYRDNYLALRALKKVGFHLYRKLTFMKAPFLKKEISFEKVIKRRPDCIERAQ
jgi:ribosomal protein S18 acetylase RimI-like enzyme